jgi:predicted ArsR family transcriptional regulator
MGTMNLSIRERSQKVAALMQHHARMSISAMATQLGISKSSVHRHQQRIVQRQQHPESLGWESEAGSQWLKLMVVGVV